MQLRLVIFKTYLYRLHSGFVDSAGHAQQAVNNHGLNYWDLGIIGKFMKQNFNFECSPK